MTTIRQLPDPGPGPGRKGIVLVGHGAVAKDCPRDLVRRFKALEARRGANGGEPSAEERELDERIRLWPRTAGNDSYRAGIEALADHLKPLLPGDTLVVAYNEFCAPSVEEAVQELIEQEIRDITVVPTMMTPGGAHSEVDIPRALERARAASPEVEIRYAWPFDLDRLAKMLADHLVDRGRSSLRSAEAAIAFSMPRNTNRCIG